MFTTILTIAVVVILILIVYICFWDINVSEEDKHNRFDRILRENLDDYKRRPRPKIGNRYIRNSLDNLIEKGYEEPQSWKEEYNQIVWRKSKLPRAERKFIFDMVGNTFMELEREIQTERTKTIKFKIQKLWYNVRK